MKSPQMLNMFYDGRLISFLIKLISDCSESFVPLTTRGQRIILSDIFPLFCVVSEVASDLDFFQNGCLQQTFVKLHLTNRVAS